MLGSGDPDPAPSGLMLAFVDNLKIQGWPLYGEIFKFIYPSHHALAWVQHCRVSWLHALVEVSPLGAWGPGAAQKSAKRCDVAVTVTRTGR